MKTTFKIILSITLFLLTIPVKSQNCFNAIQVQKIGTLKCDTLKPSRDTCVSLKGNMLTLGERVCKVSFIEEYDEVVRCSRYIVYFENKKFLFYPSQVTIYSNPYGEEYINRIVLFNK